MKKVKILLAFSFWVVACWIFWALFFRLAPYISSTIPVSEWTAFLRIVITIIIAYFGGIVIPLFFVIVGFRILLLIKKGKI